MDESQATELYRRYRPQKLKDVVGQESAVQTLQNMLTAKRIPHAILLSGGSGVGKTTIARILKQELNCADWDFKEVNAANDGGIDFVRYIVENMGLRPMNGDCRIWLIDEAHALTKAAQGDFLKPLEDTPDHVYFFLATTNPEKLLPTIRTRCTEINLSPLSPTHLTKLLNHVSAQEGKAVTAPVLKKILECADASARKALVLLHQVLNLADEKSQILAIQSYDNVLDAFAIVKALLWQKTKWPQVAELIKKADLTNLEGLRQAALTCAKNEMLKGGPNANRAYLIATVFAEDWFTTKEAGLVKACWEVCHTRDE